MSSRHRSLSRCVLAGVIAIAAAASAAGCSTIDRHVGDAWSVTYEISVDRPVGTKLADIAVEGAKRRGDKPMVQQVGTRETDTANATGSQWTRDVVVLAKQHASVSATPADGATATCRILLDGKREVAKQTSPAAGAPVECSVDTPKFD